MEDADTPDGVDPALWNEFWGVADRVSDLVQQRQEGEVTPPTCRMVLDVPEEWLLLFAWISNRERRQRQGRNGATGLAVEQIVPNRIMRELARRYIWRALNSEFHYELQALKSGRSALLRPRQPEPPKAAPQGAGWDGAPGTGDLDDDLPF